MSILRSICFVFWPGGLYSRSWWRLPRPRQPQTAPGEFSGCSVLYESAYDGRMALCITKFYLVKRCYCVAPCEKRAEVRECRPEGSLGLRRDGGGGELGEMTPLHSMKRLSGLAGRRRGRPRVFMLLTVCGVTLPCLFLPSGGTQVSAGGIVLPHARRILFCRRLPPS